MSSTVTSPVVESPSSQSILLDVPDEVLVQIFEHYRNAQLDNFLQSQTVAKEPPFLLVCRRWNEVSLDAPSLWSHIFIAENTSVNRIELYLARSKAHPIHILVKQSRAQKDRDFDPLFNTVIAHIARWKSLRVELTDNRDPTHPLGFLQYLSPPILEYLSVGYRSDTERYGYTYGQYSIFEDAPLLRHFELFNVNPNLCQVPVYNVTTLNVEGADRKYHIVYDGFRDLLLSLPYLEKLIVQGPISSYQEGTVIEAASLRILVLATDYGINPSSYLNLCQSIIAPHLEALHLSPAVPDESIQVLEYLTENASRYPGLNTFEFRPGGTSHLRGAQLHFLDARPISHLILGAYLFELVLVASDARGGNFLPSLTELTMHCRTSAGIKHYSCPDVNKLLHWVKLRKRAGLPLHKVSLAMHTILNNPEVMAELRAEVEVEGFYRESLYDTLPPKIKEVEETEE